MSKRPTPPQGQTAEDLPRRPRPVSDTAPTKPVNRRELRVRLAQATWNAERCGEPVERRAREIWDSMPPPPMPATDASRPPAGLRARRRHALEQMLWKITHRRREPLG